MNESRTDEETAESRPQASYAYLRTDGTAYIVGGSAVAGIAAYAYQLLGGRTLGAEAFAPVSVLLTIHFLTFIVLLLPIEQLVVRRLTIDRARAGLPASALWLGILTVIGATVFAWVGVDEYLNGDERFIGFTTLTVGGHLVFAAARGHLAGWRRFHAYGNVSAGASLLRLAVAILITVIHPSASGFAVGLLLGPAVVMLWRPFRRVSVEREELGEDQRASLSDKGLLSGLVLAAAASQALLLSGPIVVGLLGGTAVEISIAFAAFTLGRAPLVFGYNLLARVLPPFTEMAARGERQELRAWARGMGWAAVGLGAVAVVLGWLLGPWVIEMAFGPEFMTERVDAAVIAVGVVFAGAGLFVGQILVARGSAIRLGIAWLVGLTAATLAVAATPGLGPVARVSVAFAAGAGVALAALVIGAVLGGDGEATTAYLVSKRTIDIAASLVLLMLALPLIVIAGVAVRAGSSGPVFFTQTRFGKDGGAFGLVKIRTMEADADESVFAEHLALLEASRHVETAPPIRIDQDHRVTPVGRFLRRWSIDELPNFWNVLRGSMTLVGPRPLVPAEAELIGLDNPRFEVKPGITGLAQVQGRDAISLDERTRLDEEYVSRRSQLLDLKILARTAAAVFSEPGE